MLKVIRKLRTLGVLGINRRNSDYVLALNPRRLFPLVDDKLRTKELAIEAGMAVPELYGVVRTQHDIRRLAAQRRAVEMPDEPGTRLRAFRRRINGRHIQRLDRRNPRPAEIRLAVGQIPRARLGVPRLDECALHEFGGRSSNAARQLSTVRKG